MHINFHHAIYHFKVLSNKMIILSRNCPFVVVLRLNENGEPVFIYIKEKKSGNRSGIFFFFFFLLLMIDLNFRI